jgi:asparagine synthase (glutamine-hydrolysing)
MGVKPFYYATDARRFVCGSDLRQVLAALPARPEPNEGFIAEVLARSIQSQEETFYEGVRRLPAAHTLTVTAGAVRVSRYWALDPERELLCASDQDYAEQFRVLFTEAVKCRLRTSAPVGAYLSGGLDSSAVVGMARSLGARFDTYSLVLPDDPFADESRYIDAVARRWELTSHRAAVREWAPERYRGRLAARGDMVDLPADATGEALYPLMRRDGVRVALTGVGGDYGLAGSLYHYADLLQDGHLSEFVRQVWADAQISDVGWSASQLFWSGIRPLLPARLKQAARPLARTLGVVPGLAPWIDPRLAQRVDLRGRLAAARPPQTGAYSRRHVCTLFASGWPYWLLESAERRAAEYGVEERHPFFDRRIIEFVLAIPERQRWQGRYTKFVLRNALHDLLPAAVLERTDKGDYSICLSRAMAAVDTDGLFDDLQIGALGWVKRREVTTMRRRARDLHARGDEAFSEPMFNLWMIAAVELWFRQTYGGGVSDEATVPRPVRRSPEPAGAPAAVHEAGAGRVRVGRQADAGLAHGGQ